MIFAHKLFIYLHLIVLGKFPCTIFIEGKVFSIDTIVVTNLGYSVFWVQIFFINTKIAENFSLTHFLLKLSRLKEPNVTEHIDSPYFWKNFFAGK